MKTLPATILTLILLYLSAAWADTEIYTHKLTQSDATHQFWTTPPSERVFKDSPLPDNTENEIKVYAAQNEFEPFQLIIKPASSGNVSISISEFGTGIVSEIYQVRYVNISTPTDYLGRTGDNPDPLFPIENNSTVSLTANQNTALWFSVFVPKTAASGDYSAQITVGSISIPVKLHVFNFAIPDEIHVKSYLNISHDAIYTKYAAGGDNRLTYRDKINQYMIDHRVTPRRIMPPGGMLSASGASPYIDYDCTAHTFSDPYGEDGFDIPAKKYLRGEGFNDGSGFPAFQVAGYKTSTSNVEQRGSLCGMSASGWMADYPFSSGSFNDKWFNAYIPAIRNYLNAMGILDKAYYCINDEPQNQADYDAVAWYAQELKRVAPDLKIMVAEQPRSEIYNHAKYTGAKVDIWDAHFGTNNYDPDAALERLKQGEETWIYFLHNTYLPRFNPITIDHPGIESKMLGWFLWKYRLRGFEYWRFNEWSTNPWTSPRDYEQNGNGFLLYPPKPDNTNLSAYGENNHRFVPSIRFELMRDGLEDYEYFYLLNSEKQPQPDQNNPADEQVSKIIRGLTAYNRDSEFMYNLRRLTGLKIGGEISVIPDIVPESAHPRSQGAPGNYYINFQDPKGKPTGTVIYNGNEYMKIGNNAYDKTLGYGWYYAPDGDLYQSTGLGYDEWAPDDERIKSDVRDTYGRQDTFEFDLPNGTYNVTACAGYRNPNSPRTHKIIIEGITVIDESTQGTWVTQTKEITVKDKKLTMEMGMFDKISYINYLDIEAVSSPTNAPVADFTADKTSGNAPLTVKFTDTSANTPTSWQWDFDNDGTADATDQYPTYIYENPGTYTVTLTVSNADGSNTKIRTDYITVSATPIENPPVADFTADKTSGNAPLTVKFTDTSANTPTSWQWDFDNDGNMDSTDQHPTHIYENTGTYTVTLTVENAYGNDTKTRTDYITVSEDIPGETIRVTPSQVGKLKVIAKDLTPGTTLLFADGTYALNGDYMIISAENITIRSESGNREAVILDGNYESTEIIQITASDCTVSDMTLKRTRHHPIHVMATDEIGNVENTVIRNVHIIDPGQQGIKINQSPSVIYFADNGIIENCRIELTDAGREKVLEINGDNEETPCYTGGVDAHRARGWIVRDNIVEGFWCEEGFAEHAIHFWTGSRDTIVERNILIDNFRGIGFGLEPAPLDEVPWRTYEDNPCPDAVGNVGHYGGIIRNNFIFQKRQELYDSEFTFDSGISLDQACGAKVVHNTVVSTKQPFSSIEWRFPNTYVEIKNNLVSHNLKPRDNGTAALAGNVTDAPLSWFADTNTGNLHLLETATDAIDKGVPLGSTLAAYDIDGDMRDAMPDVGADEYKTTTSPLLGDVDGNGSIEINDAILALQVMAGMHPAVNKNSDVDKDGSIGLAESVYVLQKIILD